MKHLYRRHNPVLERPECWCDLTLRPEGAGFVSSPGADTCDSCVRARRAFYETSLKQADEKIRRAAAERLEALRILQPFSFHRTDEPYNAVG